MSALVTAILQMHALCCLEGWNHDLGDDRCPAPCMARANVDRSEKVSALRRLGSFAKEPSDQTEQGPA